MFFNSIGEASSLMRKLIRVLRILTVMKGAFDRIKNAKKITLILIFRVISSISESLYFLTDHVLLLNKIKAIQDINPALLGFCNYYGDVLWLLETVTAMIADSLELIEINKLISLKSTTQPLNPSNNLLQSLSESEQFENFKLEKGRRFTNFLRCFFDLPVLLLLKII